ncbi:Gfo/Idh/MocA family protein [Planctomicrobium sp. SH668]|uniref:Gfo/Idh/MocA family protein n=1 Tax=Planctomicrobium sp. SH668 TaxID=3448126 RepID=UPI003F5BC2A5
MFELFSSSSQQSISRRVALKAGCLGLTSIAVGSQNAVGKDRPQRKVRIGQIGVTHGHANKLQVFKNHSEFEIVGVAEPNPEQHEMMKSSRLYGDLKHCSVEELLSSPNLDAVLIETDIRDLLLYSKLALEAGKHIHLDKPAGSSLPELQEVIDIAKQRNLFVQLGYMYRYSPAVQLLHQFLQQGWLGDVFEIHAVMSKVVDPTFRKVFSEFTGGTMFELGCHLVDLVVGILGVPDSIHSYLKHSGKFDDSLNDNCLAVFDYPQARATIVSTGLEVDGFARRHLVVCGTQGTFSIQPLDNPSATITLETAQGDFKKGTQTVTFPRFDRYIAEADELARVVRGDMPIPNRYQQEIDVQRSVLLASGMETIGNKK